MKPKLEDTVDQTIIIGVPSGEVIFIEDKEKLKELRDKGLTWIRIMPDFKFANVFSDFHLKKIKELINI